MVPFFLIHLKAALKHLFLPRFKCPLWCPFSFTNALISLIIACSFVTDGTNIFRIVLAPLFIPSCSFMVIFQFQKPWSPPFGIQQSMEVRRLCFLLLHVKTAFKHIFLPRLKSPLWRPFSFAPLLL